MTELLLFYYYYYYYLFYFFLGGELSIPSSLIYNIKQSIILWSEDFLGIVG